jgi:uncharacterized protein
MASSPPGDGWSILPDGWSWSDVGHGILDIGGVFPVLGEGADLANAAWYAAEGNYLDAGLSIVSMVPIVGDIVGKGGKLAKKAGGKLAGPAVDALKKMDFKKMLEPLAKHPKIGPHVDKIAEALEKWRKDLIGEAPCTPGGTQTCPNGGSSYKGTVRGQSVNLPDVDSVPVNYQKRNRDEYLNLRRQFDSGARASFAKSLVVSPDSVAAARRAGLDDAAIARLAEGKIPQGYQVHHKLPLDDGGTNALDNLVLIKNDPFHIALSNAQRELVGDLAVGSSRQVNFPIPRGNIYPPGQ